MKIIDPTFEILDEYFREERILEQIERAGRICYKSEDKIHENSAGPFIKRIIQRGHESVLEMGQFVFECHLDSDTIMYKFLEKNPRFNQIDKLEKRHFLVSGNPRSFRDLTRICPEQKVVKALLTALTDEFPVLYEDLRPKHGWISPDGVRVRRLSPAEIDALSLDLFIRHRTLLVKLVINRAVTHELVRHRPASYLQESQRYCRYGEARFGGEVYLIRPCFYHEGTEEFRIWKRAMEESEKTYLRLLKTSSPQAARTVLPNSCKTEIMVNATLSEWAHILRLRTSQAADPSMREIMLKLLAELTARFPEVFGPIREALQEAVACRDPGTCEHQSGPVGK